MLLHDYTYIPLPADRVREQILAGQGSWLAPLALEAEREGEALRMRLGPSSTVPVLSKAVRVVTGEPLVKDSVTMVPLTISADGAANLFPTLSCDLEVAALGERLTQLTLRGRYEPPLGPVGRQIDRLLMHRVAEASVRAFLGQIAQVLSHEEAPGLAIAAGAA